MVKAHDAERSDPAEQSLLGVIDALGNKVKTGDDGHWHVTVDAPRWALRTPGSELLASAIAAIGALGLAGLAVALAWHTTNQLATANADLAFEVGAWATIGVLLIGAAIAAFVAFRNKQLHLRMTQLTGGDDAAQALAASATGSGTGGGTSGGTATGPGPAAAAAGAADAAAHTEAAAAYAVAAGRAADNSAPDAAASAASAATAHAAAAAAAAATGAPAQVGSGVTSGTPTGSKSAPNPATTISPKVVAGGTAGAVAFSFWTIAAATFWKHTFTSDALSALVGSTTAIVSTAAAYLRNDPLRRI